MHLTLHLTTACNMGCSYCYAPPHDGRPMSEAVGRQALDLGSRLTSGSCGIVFFGGEPLLCRDRIQSLVAYGREQERRQAGRFHFKITTNGLLLDDAFLEFAVRNDVLIAMSFDGVADAHDRHRRLAGDRPSFDVLLPRLKSLLAVRPYASVLMVVNPDTAEYLVDSISFLLDLSCRYLIVSLNYAADWQEPDFRVLRKQFKRLASLYVKWTRAGRKFYLSPFEVKLSSHINRHCYRKERCELARRQLSVDPQGYLFPCVQFPKAGPDSQWCLGHVSRGIDEAARQRIHDESEAEKEFCVSCAIKDRCNNTCGCLNWQTTGSINSISPVLCRYEQMLVPIVDRVGKVLYRKRDPLFLHKHYNAAYPVLSLLEDTMTRRK
ncbi:MAG: radical SAM protein [Phycisphaerae bacterium]|nr:radical SAM protein [Phycisphaerae bacterium]